MSEFIEVKCVKDLVYIYKNQAKADFELRLNIYVHEHNGRVLMTKSGETINFWDTMEAVVNEAGDDRYNYKDLIKRMRH